MVGVLGFMLSGCKDGNETKTEVSRWTSPDKSFSLALDVSQWKVEEESAGELHFLNLKDDNFSFSVSRWENLQFPEGFDYEDYYAGYVDDIRLEFPDVVEAGVEVIALENEGTELIQMGVQYEVLEKLCQVTTSMVAVPESEDTLCFVAIYPAEKGEQQETIFRQIVSGIEFSE